MPRDREAGRPRGLREANENFHAATTGTIVARWANVVQLFHFFEPGSNLMATTRSKIKDKIDSAASKAKEATDKAADATKNAAKKVGEKVKKTGQKIKDSGD